MSICGVDRTIVSHRLVPASTSLDAQLAALTPGGVTAGGRRSAADPRAILGVRLPRAQRHVPEWRNWQTRGTQNPVGFTPRVGSIPSSGTINKALTVIRPTPREVSIRPIVPLLWLCRVSAQRPRDPNPTECRRVRGLIARTLQRGWRPRADSKTFWMTEVKAPVLPAA